MGIFALIHKIAHILLIYCRLLRKFAICLRALKIIRKFARFFVRKHAQL